MWLSLNAAGQAWVDTCEYQRGSIQWKKTLTLATNVDDVVVLDVTTYPLVPITRNARPFPFRRARRRRSAELPSRSFLGALCPSSA